MPLHIKNWKQFQHFKDRRPPWVKLYRTLLDDPEWHQLEPHAAKSLVMLWLLASEYDGQLPEAKTIAFRLRTSVADVESTLPLLGHWLGDGDIEPISDGYLGDAPETETETETEKRQRSARAFAEFWAAYPKKEGKQAAEKAFAKVEVEVSVLVAAIRRDCRKANWQKDEGRYIPHASTWLNGRRWEDEGTVPPAPASPRHTNSPEETARMLEKNKQGTRMGVPPELRGVVAHLTGKKVA